MFFPGLSEIDDGARRRRPHSAARDEDPRRLAALDSYAILDTPPEQGYDDIVLLASQICGTPIALVSLVADDRQWFKARIGFDESQTPIAQSVCAHALTAPELLVIPDLGVDPRTRGNALATGEPRIRFYAGAKLATPDGTPLGSLCVLDTVPRPNGLTREQERALAALGPSGHGPDGAAPRPRGAGRRGAKAERKRRTPSPDPR